MNYYAYIVGVALNRKRLKLFPTFLFTFGTIMSALSHNYITAFQVVVLWNYQNWSKNFHVQ